MNKKPLLDNGHFTSGSIVNKLFPVTSRRMVRQTQHKSDCTVQVACNQVQTAPRRELNTYNTALYISGDKNTKI